MTRILQGDIEPIIAKVVDGIGGLVIGADVTVRIQRTSDEFFYDWDDDTFKVFGSVGTPDQTLLETVNQVGIYTLNTVTHPRGWDTSEIVNVSADDTYILTLEVTAPLGALAPEPVEIKVDQWPRDVLDDTSDIQTRLPAVLVGGRMDSDVAIIQAPARQTIADTLETSGTNPHGTGAWDATATVPAQTIRDAMKLAPTAGAPTVGSVDRHLDDIETDATAIQALILSAQEVRDAMKLAPAGGAPAVGSVDEHLDDILADTAAMQPLVTANVDVAISTRAAPGDAMTLTGPALSSIFDEDVSGRVASPSSAGRILDMTNKLLRGRIRTNPVLNRLELYDPVDDSLILAWALKDFAGGPIVSVAGAPFNRDKAVET